MSKEELAKEPVNRLPEVIEPEIVTPGETPFAPPEPSAPEKAPGPSGRKFSRWWIPVWIWIVFYLLWSCFGPVIGRPKDISFLLRPALLGALFYGLIFWALTFRRWRGRGVGTFIAVFFVVRLLGGSVYSVRVGKDAEATERIKQNALQWMETDEPLPEDSSVSGQAGEIDRLSKKLFNECLVLKHRYLERLDKAGIGRLFLAGRLAADRELEDSYRILDECEAIRADYQRELKRLLTVRIQELTDEAKLPEKVKAELKKGYERNTESMLIARRILQLEQNIIVAFREAVDLLKRTREHWSVEDGGLVFARDEDLKVYEAIFARVEVFIAEQAKLQESEVERLKAL